MIKLVLRQLLLDKGNTVITLLALSAAVAVIVILLGFEQGQYQQLKFASLNRGADLIAVQSNIKNFVATRSVIPQQARAQIESIAGVIAAHPITTLPVIYKHGAMQTPVYMIVFDSSGGPAQLIDGTAKTLGQYIVVDESLAKQYRLNVGDEFVVAGFSFEVSGITKEAAFMTPFAFVNYDGLIDFFMDSEVASDLSTFPLLSFMLIDVEDVAVLHQVSESIERTVGSIDVYTPEEIANNDVRLGKGFYKPILGLLISVGFLLGSLLICLLMFSTVNRYKRDFAVMMALGFQTRSLLVYTFSSSFILIILALLLGLALSNYIVMFIESARPVYYFAIFHPDVLVKAVAAISVFGLLGAIAPYLAIRKTDPVIALQSVS